MFATVRRILEIAGGGPGDVVKMNVWMKDRSQRPHLNKGWLDMFPDPHSRPALTARTPHIRVARPSRFHAGAVIENEGTAFRDRFGFRKPVLPIPAWRLAKTVPPGIAGLPAELAIDS